VLNDRDGGEQQQRYNVTFTPGMAVLHRGMLRHAAYPIRKGERIQLIIWVFGPGGYVRVAPNYDSDNNHNNKHRRLFSQDDGKWKPMNQMTTTTKSMKNDIDKRTSSSSDSLDELWVKRFLYECASGEWKWP